MHRLLLLTALIAGLAACSSDTGNTAKLRAAADDTETVVDSETTDTTETVDTTDTTDGTTPPEDTAVESYIGPSYDACVTDAECAPGDACTTVSGFAGHYCAPPCDPEGDGGECDLGGLDFDTTCTAAGRCARVCGEDDCPEGLDCQPLEDLSLDVCAGEEAGGSGYYGTCSHPQADGTDCPDDAACFGGDLVGSETGMCLPWCGDLICPAPPEGIDAYPFCYDIGLGSPTCALICDQNDPDAVCPDGQTCYDAYYLGLCLPEDAVLDLDAIEDLF